MRRGDNIPDVSEYAHWNEDAQAVWYAENRYDMEHWDEEMDDDGPYGSDRDYDEPEPDIEETFDTEAEARAFYDSRSATAHYISLKCREAYGGREVWDVTGYSTELYESRGKRRRN